MGLLDGGLCWYSAHMHRPSLLAAIVIVSVFVLFVGARISGILGVRFASGLSLQDETNLGGRIVYLGCCVSISENDIIVYREQGRDYARRVSEVSNDRWFIVEHSKGNLRAVARSDVLGKVVFATKAN